MNIYLDTEFVEQGRGYGIEFVSIGLYADDGREYYAVNADMDTAVVASHEWVMDNVMIYIDHIKYIDHNYITETPFMNFEVTDEHAKSRLRIAAEVRKFIKDTPKPQLWAWYSAWDHVVLSQLFGNGTFFEMPPEIPKWTNDIKTLHRQAGLCQMPKQPANLHNALDDAKFNKTRYDFLMEKINGNQS